MEGNNGKKAVKAGVWYTVANFVTKGAMFLTTPLFTRMMSKQDINAISEINVKTSFNDNPIPYIMEKSHSVDIDELNDLALAEYYIKSNK